MTKVAFENIETTTMKGRALLQLAQAAYGAKEFATVRLSGNVADAETLTIASKKFHIKQINTAIGTIANTKLNNTTPGVATAVDFSVAHGLSVGHVVRVNSEYLLCTRVVDSDTADLQRGYAGSTIAAQASGQSAFRAANYTGVNLVTEVVVPVGATLTPAAAGPELATGLTALNPFKITASYLTAGTQLLLEKEAAGNVTAVAEAMANATVDATFRGGVARGDVVASTVNRAPTAQEVTDGFMHFVLPFTVKSAIVTVRVTATDAAKAWDGAKTVSGRRVTLDNSGTTDWATTDTVIVQAFG